MSEYRHGAIVAQLRQGVIRASADLMRALAPGQPSRQRFQPGSRKGSRPWSSLRNRRSSIRASRRRGQPAPRIRLGRRARARAAEGCRGPPKRLSRSSARSCRARCRPAAVSARSVLPVCRPDLLHSVSRASHKCDRHGSAPTALGEEEPPGDIVGRERSDGSSSCKATSAAPSTPARSCRARRIVVWLPSPGTTCESATRRAGASSSSPARAAPPPSTTSSGSNVLIALAMPIPTR